MGLFNKKNNEENTIITVLEEIRDNLKIDNTETVNALESKINDAHYHNDEEIGVITNRLTQMEKQNGKLQELVLIQEKSISNLENMVLEQGGKIETLIDVNKSLIKILESIVKEKPTEKIKKPKKEVTVEIPKKPTIRQYPISITTTMPKITKMTKNGKFILKRGSTSKYTIEDVLKVKQYINTDLKFSKIAEKVGLSASTVTRICCAIEYGIFDQYFNEWEQIQADKIFGNWKPILENNPEKRKEKGYV